MTQPVVKSPHSSGDGWHSRGYLPHFDGGSLTQAVTFRLADSLPAERLLEWRGQLAPAPDAASSEAYYDRIESYLNEGHGEALLRQPAMARIVEDALLYFDAQRYRLIGWVVMPNHVHVVVTPEPGWTLSSILHTWKSYTSRAINRHLGRHGQVWQEEYFDRFIRDRGHLVNAVAYVEDNPVKAGLCKHPEDWVYSSAYARLKKR